MKITQMQKAMLENIYIQEEYEVPPKKATKNEHNTKTKRHSN